MYITIQYPLFDSRLLYTGHNRSNKPDPVSPRKNDVLRYIGEVIDVSSNKLPILDKSAGKKKIKRFFGSWDSDKKYFDASSVFALAGLGDHHYYKKLRHTPFNSHVLFRRLQIDPYFLSKFEMGWTDSIEKLSENNHVEKTNDFFTDHIRKYLECDIKIKVGVKHRNDIAVADASQNLIYTYYWATNKNHTKSFKNKELEDQIEYLSPYLIIHTEKDKWPLTEMGFNDIKIPGIEKDGLQLFYGSISYLVKDTTKSIDAWIITSANPGHYKTIKNQDFQDFPSSLKSLRRNLLHIPSQIHTLQKLNTCLNTHNLTNSSEEIAHDTIARFIHKSITTLNNDKSTNLDQQPIINAIFNRFGEDHYHDLESEYQNAINWFKFLPTTAANENMKAELNALEFKKRKVYISSTFRDLKDYRQVLISLFQNELSKKFELSKIMEWMFDDGSHTPFVSDCIQAVEDSDIYFIIIGNKAGSFPPHETRTYTEIEYDTAVKTNKKIFMFRLKDFIEAEIDNKAKHDELLNKFNGKPGHVFTDKDNFEKEIIKVLLQF